MPQCPETVTVQSDAGATTVQCALDAGHIYPDQPHTYAALVTFTNADCPSSVRVVVGDSFRTIGCAKKYGHSGAHQYTVAW